MSEWGPWIEHDGRGCPCVGMFVLVREFSGGLWQGFAGDECRATGTDPNGVGSAWAWAFNGRIKPEDVRRYRIRKPRALEQLREIARNPERELEDA